MISAWLQAARPLAHANIAIPLIFGQALAFSAFHTFSWKRCLWVHTFGLLSQLFIVFANDVADFAADKENQDATPFSGGSRVLVEGQLSPAALAKAALGCAVLLGVLGLALTLTERLPLALLLVTCPLFLLWAYSFPPARLSYRGGGEHLQALGVGVVLPIVGFYFQASTLSGFPWLALVPTYALGWAGNVVTAVPDEDSDRRAAKLTVPVRMGGGTARILALCAITVALIATPWATPELPRWVWFASGAPALLALVVALFSPQGSGRDAIPFVLAAGSAGLLAQIGWSAAVWLS